MTQAKTSPFDDLFVFEMANNHQGSVEHGLRIIESMAELSRKHQINASLKLQYRQLDTFIHPDFRDRTDVPHIPRFISTELSPEQFKAFIDATRASGMQATVTPFDEASVDVCLEHDVDIIKLASCSASDWPLIEKIAEAGKPVLLSTGGQSLSDIDKLVSFFTHTGTEFALMHCVALYPTPNEDLQMGVVQRLSQRYPQVKVGYSGHEAPDNLDAVKVAVAMGAQLLERHVGVPTDTITLNKYSMNPEEVDAWITAAKTARTIAHNPARKLLPEKEKDSLLSLQRGVYAKGPIKKGTKLSRDDVFFAMPCQDSQVTSGQFGAYRTEFVASRDYASNEAVFEITAEDTVSATRGYIHRAKGLLREARIHLGNEINVELSHHYGLERFGEVGCLIVNIINREYCKKLIVVLPGQSHPNHRHVKKEETFQLLHGQLHVDLNGVQRTLAPGELVLVERGAWHAFSSEEGAVFEEISTTHHLDDSFYEDPSIAKLDPIQRKTYIDQW